MDKRRAEESRIVEVVVVSNFDLLSKVTLGRRGSCNLILWLGVTLEVIFPFFNGMISTADKFCDSPHCVIHCVSIRWCEQGGTN